MKKPQPKPDPFEEWYEREVVRYLGMNMSPAVAKMKPTLRAAWNAGHHEGHLDGYSEGYDQGFDERDNL